ncbi:MAG: DUF2203 domain-containing protein [Ktedonobacterales bacterium]
MPDYFTRAEAEALLPRLTTLLRETQSLRNELADRETEYVALQRRLRSNGHSAHPEQEALPAQIVELTQRLMDRARAISALGVLIKDIEMGLVDFPALRNGREVYLCWRLHEEHVAWWHEVESGFTSRQPLEDE